MIKISLPNNNQAERQYIVDVLLVDYLGLENIQVNFTDQKDISIQLKNGNQLIFHDHFFNQYPKSHAYLSNQNIPEKVKYTSNTFCPENDIPILFGNEELRITDSRIICGNDIFAACFFMLSRWEEYANPARDHFNRFASKDSLAEKANFLHRPIVNEYLEMLWQMLKHLGIQQNRKKQSFNFLLTHDVDIPRMWTNPFSIIKTLGGSLLKRRNIKEANYYLQLFSKKQKTKKDPFDTFDYIMSLSEKNNIQSNFFFMSGGLTSFDNFYKINAPHILDLIDQIHKRGHHIGIHPSFDAYHNSTQFGKELKRLQEFSPQKISTGREHFLRFEIPTTWQIWEDHHMEWDSTLCYADKQGFRCGTCYPFPVFNILTRKKLKLIERPLIVMDGNYITYQNVSPEEMFTDIQMLLQKVKKYQGEFVLLWHNSAFYAYEWKDYRAVYQRVLEEAKL